jgi:hypothetical protein
MLVFIMVVSLVVSLMDCYDLYYYLHSILDEFIFVGLHTEGARCSVVR